MELKEALYIYTVAKYKNITRAAEELHVSQPSLSKYISQYEYSLGLPLFTRIKNHLSLTYAGEVYTETAQKILSLNRQLDKRIRDIRNLSEGKIVIGTPAAIGSYVLPHVLPVFQARFPDIRVDIVESSSSELEEFTVNNELDFAIMHRMIDNPLLEYRTIEKTQVILVCSNERAASFQTEKNDHSSYPCISIEQLKHVPMVIIKEGGRLRSLINSTFLRYRIEPEILFETSNVLTAYQLACDGYGVTIIPDTMHHFLNRSCGVFSFNEADFQYDLVVSNVKAGFLSAASNAFIDVLFEVFAPDDHTI